MVLALFIATGVVDLGMEVVGSHFVARGDSPLSVLGFGSLAAALATAPGTAVAAGIYAYAGAGSIRQVLPVYVAFVLATLLARTGRGVLNGQRNFSASAVSRLMSSAIVVVLAGSLYAAGELTPFRLLMAACAGAILSACTGIVLIDFSHVDLPVRTAQWSGYLRYSVKIWGWANLQNLMFRLDHVLVGALAGPAALGLYSYAATLADGLTYVPSAAGEVLLPKWSGLVGRGHVETGADSRLIRRFTVVSSLAVAGGGLFVFHPLTEVLVGKEFAPSRGAFIGLALAAGFLSLGRLSGLRLASAGAHGVMMVAAAVGSSVVLVGTAFSLLMLGPNITYVAMATLAGYAAYYAVATNAESSATPRVKA